MARCHSCGKNLGWGLFSKRVTMDGHRFCQPCSEEWSDKRRQRVLSQICEGGDPVEIFNIPRVRTKDADRPKGRELLLGMAAFTDRGVCFIQTARHTKADPGWALAFGLIGHAFAESAARKNRDKAFARGQREMVEKADGFTDLLRRSEQLLFYPRQEITRLKFDSKGFNIRLGRLRKRFATEGGRKAFKQFREIAETYRSAIERGTDPVLACKHLSAEPGRGGFA